MTDWETDHVRNNGLLEVKEQHRNQQKATLKPTSDNL